MLLSEGKGCVVLRITCTTYVPEVLQVRAAHIATIALRSFKLPCADRALLECGSL